MDELALAGIQFFGGPDDNDKHVSFSEEIQQDTDVGVHCSDGVQVPYMSESTCRMR